MPGCIHSEKCVSRKKIMQCIFTLNRHEKYADFIVFVSKSDWEFKCFHCKHMFEINDMGKEYKNGRPENSWSSWNWQSKSVSQIITLRSISNYLLLIGCPIQTVSDAIWILVIGLVIIPIMVILAYIKFWSLGLLIQQFKNASPL